MLLSVSVSGLPECLEKWFLEPLLLSFCRTTHIMILKQSELRPKYIYRQLISVHWDGEVYEDSTSWSWAQLGFRILLGFLMPILELLCFGASFFMQAAIPEVATNNERLWFLFKNVFLHLSSHEIGNLPWARTTQPKGYNMTNEKRIRVRLHNVSINKSWLFEWCMFK